MPTVFLGALKPQPNHPPEVLARAVRLPPGASSQDPVRSLEDPRLNHPAVTPWRVVPPATPIGGDRAGDRADGHPRYSAAHRYRLAVLRWFSEHPEPQTTSPLAIALGLPYSGIKQALLSLWRDGKLQRRTATTQVTNRRSGYTWEYWPTGTQPGIDPRGKQSLTSRILYVLRTAPPDQVWLLEDIAAAMGETKRTIGSTMYHLSADPKVERRLCYHSRGKCSQYRWTHGVPWPPLPDGWRLADEVRSEGKGVRGKRRARGE